jgi:hypothetical protein
MIDPPVTSYHSTDGVHWSKGRALDTAAAGTQSDFQEIRSVIEGPAGLLAVGWSGACGSEYLDALWTSTDGISWQPVNVQTALAGSTALIARVSGGSAGYTAVTYYGSAVWTSANGRVWKPVALTATAFANSKVNDATAFSGGYVLAGTSGARDCAAFVGPTPTPPVRSATVWWSADSTTWTRIPLPGADLTSDGHDPWICRISDHALLVFEGDASGKAWISTDGRNWTPVSAPAAVTESNVFTDGVHGLVISPPGDSSGTNNLSVQAFSDGGTLRQVNQTGSVPTGQYHAWGMGELYGMAALGPTGIVVTDGTNLWIGLPS